MLVAYADEIWVSKWGLNGTGTVGTACTPSVWNCNTGDLKLSGLWFVTHQAIVLLVVHMAFNPHLDTNMAKLAICVKDYVPWSNQTVWGTLETNILSNM